MLQLSEFDIAIINPKGIRSQALADLLAQFLAGQHEPRCEDLPCEEVDLVEDVEWRLAFDGSATYQGGGRGEGKSCAQNDDVIVV